MSGEELIALPNVSNTIITLIKNDYPEIKELLEYKRDATLAFLKSQGALAIYKGGVELNVAKEVKDWNEFVEFAAKYSKYIVQKGIQTYQENENDLPDSKKQFNKLEKIIVDPAVEMISNSITSEYLHRFPSWPKSGTQSDFIEINLKSAQEVNDYRIYWTCSGQVFVKDTKYDIPINGNKYKAEFSGKPEFQFSFFDMKKIKFCNDMAKKNMKLLKSKIDELDEKLLTQQMDKLLLNGFDF
jgi:hypothetical protein